MWFGHTRELPTAGAAFGLPPTSPQSPAGPPPPGSTRDGAEPAQPAKRRRLTELTAVAVLAALLASGGTFAATQLVDGSQPSSSASSSTLGRGTDNGPVVQADQGLEAAIALAQVVGQRPLTVQAEALVVGAPRQPQLAAGQRAGGRV